jgi:methionyl-tRNA synthetase
VSFYVTTPIYYVNAQPHLGHAYTTIAADVLARHRRQRGEDVFFLTGTDEHGEPVADAAKAQGLEPQELADRNAERFKALMPRLDASNDFFIRTTDEEHKTRVQEVLLRVRDNGHVYQGIYEGWYCPRCADFKVENEIIEGNRCPIHLIDLTREREENWFFRLSTFQSRLERLYAEQPDFVMPAHHYNEALSFITSGLQDVSLSRGRLKWGVTVPWDHTHVFYVWFDALLNYYTALGYARPGQDLTDEFWPATYHIIGKDILKFHTVFWPALLMAADLPIPEHVFVHGFLLGADGRKMSKSLGNVLDPFEVMDQFGTDALRFYLMRDVAFGSDGSVGMDAVRARYDAELANEYGNLASRTIAMIQRYRDGLIWHRVRRLNRYVEETAPWQLARDLEAADALDRTLASLAEGLRAVSVLLYPYMPATVERLLEALGAPDTSYASALFAEHGNGATVSALEPLFPRDR